jgi:hypothetical protein
MGLFWGSANGNGGIGLSTPTPLSRAWRPSEESVAIAAAVIGKPPTTIGLLVLERDVQRAGLRLGRGLCKANIDASSLGLSSLRLVELVGESSRHLTGGVGHQPSRKESQTGLTIRAQGWLSSTGLTIQASTGLTIQAHHYWLVGER